MSRYIDIMMKYIDMSRYIDIMRKSKKSTPSFP